MKKEDILKKQYGKKNPFTVPEGYFDKFTENMMSILPSDDSEAHAPAAQHSESESAQRATLHTFLHRCRPYLYLAAMFAGLYFCIQITSTIKQDKTSSVHSTEISASAPSQASTTSDDIETICEYAGIGKDQIYSYVLEYSSEEQQ